MSTSSQLPEQRSAPMHERRSFLGALFAIVGGVVSATLAVPLIRFATYPLRATAGGTSWSDVGKMDEFTSLTAPVTRTIHVERVDGWRSSFAQNAVYIVPLGAGKLKVLSSVCPHLGCTVRWVDKQNQFVCPCHGGIFTETGALVHGPPLRAMDSLQTKVENGMLKVRFEYFREQVADKEPMA